MRFGQFVIGPPGSGKTTYCQAISQFLRALGTKVAVVNLDPANDVLPFEVDVDILGLISVEDTMDCLSIGPNAALIHCMEFLEINLSWLKAELDRFSDCYFLFDCPGQVELYTHHGAMQSIVLELKKSDYSLTAVHLVDSFYCCDPGNFVSVLLTSLSAMIQLQMPHINVLSKSDLIEKYGKLHFSPEFYSEVLDMSHLVELLSDDPFLQMYKKLNKSLVNLVENYNLVSFMYFRVNHKESMLRVLRAANQANGYVFDVNEGNRDIQSLLSVAVGADFEDTKIAEVRESLSTLEVADFYEKEQFAKPIRKKGSDISGEKDGLARFDEKETLAECDEEERLGDDGADCFTIIPG